MTDVSLFLRARHEPDAFAAVEARAAAGAIDWDSLSDRVEAERLGPLLHGTFAHAAFIPAPVAERWRRAQRMTAAFYVVWSASLVRVCNALAQAKIPVIVLKGAALAETVYDKPSLRPLADVDILVRHEHVRATVEILQANGYLPPRVAESEEYTLDFENELPILPRNPVGITIDIHWSLLDSPYYQRALSHDWFWQSSRPFTRYGEARTLGPEAQLLHLSAHLMVHHHGKGTLWLYDIVELLRRYRTELDWERTLEEARRCELVESLRRTVERAVGELGAGIDPGRHAQIVQMHVSNAEQNVFAHPTIGKARAEHFWNDVITLPTWRTRLSYIRHRIAPSAAFMRQRYQLQGSAWLPFYYPYRWLFGAWRLGCVLIFRLARQGQRDTNDALSK
jgi:hypothetical protein